MSCFEVSLDASGNHKPCCVPLQRPANCEWPMTIPSIVQPARVGRTYGIVVKILAQIAGKYFNTFVR